MQAPTRPFESLEWFRDASAGSPRPRGPVHNALRWLKSARCFAFHIGMFALGITIALAINAARHPGDIWVDRLAIGWAILLVIHAGIALLLWAIGLLTGNDPAPVYPGPVLRPRELQANAWAPPPAAPAAPASTVTPSTEAVPDLATAWPAPPPPAPESPSPASPSTTDWSPWGQPVTDDGWTTGASAPAPTPPAPADAAESGTASWDEVNPGAWLGRRRNTLRRSAEPDEPGEEEASPDDAPAASEPKTPGEE